MNYLLNMVRKQYYKLRYKYIMKEWSQVNTGVEFNWAVAMQSAYYAQHII